MSKMFQKDELRGPVDFLGSHKEGEAAVATLDHSEDRSHNYILEADEKPYDPIEEEGKMKFREVKARISKSDIEGLIESALPESKEELEYRGVINKAAKALENLPTELSDEKYRLLVDIKYEILKAENNLKVKGESIEKEGIELGGEKGTELRQRGTEYYKDAIRRIDAELLELEINRNELLESLKVTIDYNRERLERENRIARERLEGLNPKSEPIVEVKKSGLFSRLFGK